MSAAGRVLVVDDDEDLRSVIGTRLRAAGFEVREAEDAPAAMAELRQRGWDLVLLDVRMPGMDGFQLLDWMRELVHPPEVIFLTAMGQIEDRLRGLYGGAVDYITKPFVAEELVARVRTATRRKKDLDAALSAATVDALTGLLNRRGFEVALGEEVARARHSGQDLALVCLDADGLKEVNDSLGHAAGDELLRAIARAVENCPEAPLRARAARIGGDEFGILLPGLGRDSAEEFLARLRRTLAGERYPAGGDQYVPSASFGMAILPHDAEDGGGLVAAADEVLYREKGRRSAARTAVSSETPRASAAVTARRLGS